MKQHDTITAWIEAGEGEKLDLNCAETILYGANEVLDLELSKQSLKIASGFGGGMGLEKHCGALTGSVMVFGLLFTHEKGHESDYVENLNRELTSRFMDEMGNSDCAPLKADHGNKERDCSKVILAAARILDEMIEREWHNRAFYPAD